MDIDPRLRDASQRVADAYVHAPPQQHSYTLNPILLPPPLPHNSGSSILSRDAGLPYYSVQQDPRSQAVPPSVADSQTHLNEAGNTLRPQQSSDRKDDPKRPRACEACRGLKVRCVPDPATGSCRRCAKAGRACIITVPSRKRQKKTDSRVAELEKKIDALTASLRATKNQIMSGSDGASSDDDYTHENSVPKSVDGKQTTTSAKGEGSMLHARDFPSMTAYTVTESGRKRKRAGSEDVAGSAKYASKDDLVSKTLMKEHNTPTYNRSYLLPESTMNANSVLSVDPTIPGHEYADVVDRKILDSGTAAKMFNHYTTKMAPHIPVVVFDPGISAGEIRRTMPALFLAILSVSAGHERPELQPMLFRELTQVYADRIFVRGEKSLELIQALQISSMWYAPEEHKDSRPYQFVHLAGVMAMSMGLGQTFKLQTGSVWTLWKDKRKSKDVARDAGGTTGNRAWLACYLLSGITAANARQPNLLQWNKHIEDCLYNLEKAEDSLHSDKMLVQWVKLRRLIDEIFACFKMEDLGTTTKLNHENEGLINHYDKELSNWRDQMLKGPSSQSLTLSFCFIKMYIKRTRLRLYFCEEGTGEDHSPMKPDINTPELFQFPNPAHVDAMRECLESIYETFVNFVSMSVEDIRTIPGFHFVRMAYTVVFLFRLRCTILTPGAEITKLMPTYLVQFEPLLDQLHILLQQAAAEDRSRPARNFQLALRMMKTSYERRKDRPTRPKATEPCDSNPRLLAQPIDTESTSREGYRKLSMHVDRFSERYPPAPERKPRSSSLPQPNLRLKSPLDHATPPSPSPPPTPPVLSHTEQVSQRHAPAHDSIQISHQQSSQQSQLDNTPLHLLSQLATNDASTTQHQPSVTPQGVPWYPPPPTLISNGHNASPTPIAHNSQLHHHHTYPPPTLSTPNLYPPHANYHSEPQTYYPEAHPYPDPSAYSTGGYQNLAINTGVEHAMGIPFGEEGDLAGLFMDDGVYQMMQQTGPAAAGGGPVLEGYGWDGRAGGQ